MIIKSSQLSMDASSGHMDVSKTANGKTLSRNHSGRTGPLFTLDLPNLKELSNAQESGRLSGVSTFTSSVEPDNLDVDQNDAKYVLSKTIGSIIGSGEKASETVSIIPSENGISRGNSMPRPMRKYYRIGGQQFSMSFSSNKVHYEHEYLNFNSSGTVSVADGRTINFSLELSIQRSRVVSQSVLGRAAEGYFIDPMVLNFNNSVDMLSEQSFLFDLDGDGEQEKIPSLLPGSGFLALDIDGDNTISNGRELFGPTSGHGFGELAIHDHDKNNWIDENDPIFNKLLVWMKASGGTQELLSLKEAGVGAISLTNAHSLFNLKSASDQVLGQVHSSGIFLTEDGALKSLHDLNLLGDSNELDTDSKTRASALSAELESTLATLRSRISEHRQRIEEYTARNQHRIFQEEHEEDRWDFWNWLRDRDKTLLS